MIHGNGKHADTDTHLTTSVADTGDSHAEDHSGASEVAELQADIEQTRADLAETLDLLAAKLDVKSRVRNQVTHLVNTTKETAAHQLRTARGKAMGPDGKPTPAAMSVVGGVVAAIAAVVVVRLWRGSQGHQRPRRRRALRQGH